MTIETIIDHDQPNFEPGNPETRAAVRHAAQVALFPMPLRTARTKFLPGRAGTGGDYGAELES
jgi:hypothetical protein